MKVWLGVVVQVGKHSKAMTGPRESLVAEVVQRRQEEVQSADSTMQRPWLSVAEAVERLPAVAELVQDHELESLEDWLLLVLKREGELRNENPFHLAHSRCLDLYLDAEVEVVQDLIEMTSEACSLSASYSRSGRISRRPPVEEVLQSGAVVDL